MTHNGQSQWQLIWKEFAKRKLALLSAAVIFVLIQVSIWAPFLANDRPLYYVGENRSAYRESLRTCQGAVIQLINHRQKTPNDPVPETLAKALKLHLPLLEAAVIPQDAERLAAWSEKLRTAQAETDPKASVKQLTELRKALTQELAERKVTLVNQSRSPVLASLVWLDVFFMVWSVTTILYPAWRLLLNCLPPANRLAIGGIAWVLPPVLASLAWWWFVPYREDQTAYKQGLLAANVKESAENVSVAYSMVLWPPVPYGLAESVLEKKYQRPPWWFAEKKTAEKTTEEPVKKFTHQPTPWDGPHWLGTDSTGRDVLSRAIWGGRVSLSVGVVSVSIYVTLGILIGAIAGYFRGIVDLLISRFIEIVICFPTFFLILTIVALRGPSIWNIMVVIGITGWTGVARLIRAEFLRLVDQEFVLAGRSLGYSPARLIFRHVLPNALAPVMVSATFGVANAILTESALSYLGLGITIPIPSWGSLMLDGSKSEGVAPWLIVLPGLVIFITITCYNLVGEALRDASDPRLRGSRT